MAASVDWRIKGLELSTCNCNWGCPCNFSAPPTYGDCRAAVAIRIDSGYFGETRLDGLNLCFLYAWPGPIHEGRGKIQPFVDERADAKQRKAILAIGAGEETEPAATFFSVYRLMSDTVLEPRAVPIRVEGDVKKGTGSFSIPGVIEGGAEPIRHPKTGRLNRISVFRAFGLEFKDAEFASGNVRTGETEISLQWSGRHAHLARMHMTPRGPVRD